MCPIKNNPFNVYSTVIIKIAANLCFNLLLFLQMSIFALTHLPFQYAVVISLPQGKKGAR
jgi:hypothetical protein